MLHPPALHRRIGRTLVLGPRVFCPKSGCVARSVKVWLREPNTAGPIGTLNLNPLQPDLGNTSLLPWFKRPTVLIFRQAVYFLRFLLAEETLTTRLLTQVEWERHEKRAGTVTLRRRSTRHSPLHTLKFVPLGPRSYPTKCFRLCGIARPARRVLQSESAEDRLDGHHHHYVASACATSSSGKARSMCRVSFLSD